MPKGECQLAGRVLGECRASFWATFMSLYHSLEEKWNFDSPATVVQ